MATVEQLLELLNPVVDACGAEIDNLKISKAGSRRIVEVVVDSDEGIDLDAVAAISSAISGVLDETNVMGEAPYTLEVGTRGVDSPLLTEKHWHRNAGRLVKIVGSSMDVIGRIIGTDGQTVDIDVAGTIKTYALSEISRATVQVEFKSAKQEEGE
jgi:ribosome maturation factor RimP